MNSELAKNKALQILIGSLGTEDTPDQPLGKYGRMAMEHLHRTDPQRFSRLMMSGELTSLMYRVDEEATEKVRQILQQLLQSDPMPQTEDIMVKTRYLNKQKNIAEEIVIHEMVLIPR